MQITSSDVQASILCPFCEIELGKEVNGGIHIQGKMSFEKAQLHFSIFLLVLCFCPFLEKIKGEAQEGEYRECVYLFKSDLYSDFHQQATPRQLTTE